MFDDERLVTVEVPGHECGEAHLYDSARQAVLVTTDCPMDHVYEIVPDAADRCKARVRLLAIDWGDGKTQETAALTVDVCKGPKRVTNGGDRKLKEAAR